MIKPDVGKDSGIKIAMPFSGVTSTDYYYDYSDICYKRVHNNTTLDKKDKETR